MRRLPSKLIHAFQQAAARNNDHAFLRASLLSTALIVGGVAFAQTSPQA